MPFPAVAGNTGCVAPPPQRLRYTAHAFAASAGASPHYTHFVFPLSFWNK
jgi:hypothetical protein